MVFEELKHDLVCFLLLELHVVHWLSASIEERIGQVQLKYEFANVSSADGDLVEASRQIRHIFPSFKLAYSFGMSKRNPKFLLTLMTRV